VAPEILPVLVPIVHEKVLAGDAVRLILTFVPLHNDIVVELDNTGVGFTVTVAVPLWLWEHEFASETLTNE
jgi:hypothetical protein